MRTPWGESDFEERGARGVVVVGTPGHGGVLVDEFTAHSELSEAARDIGEEFGDWYAFEEDCAWAAVGYEHPEWLFGIYCGTVSGIKEQARLTLSRWYPEYFREAESA